MTHNTEAINAITVQVAQAEIEVYLDQKSAAVTAEALLDKPFETLTKQEWEQLKDYEPEVEVFPDLEQMVEVLLSKIEVDSQSDPDFGLLYRVWLGTNILGTFYRKLFTDNWTAACSFEVGRFYCSTEDEAKRCIVRTWVNR